MQNGSEYSHLISIINEICDFAMMNNVLNVK